MSSFLPRKSLRGSRAPKAGVRGLPSPFINLDERGRETPHPTLLPLLLKREDFLDEIRSVFGAASAAGTKPKVQSAALWTYLIFSTASTTINGRQWPRRWEPPW